MKATFLLVLLASTSFASARIHPSTHALAVAISFISGPWPALAKPVSKDPTIRLNPRQANSTTSATTGTYTVVSGDISNDDASELGGGLAASGTVKATGTATATATAPKGSSSGCGGHHHHHHNSTSTAGGAAEAQNGTTHTGHHSHNGTEADGQAHNSTSISAQSGECNATSHHHHNGTEASGSATAASFFIPATATASALAVALTAPATAGDVVARAVNGFAAMLHRG